MELKFSITFLFYFLGSVIVRIRTCNFYLSQLPYLRRGLHRPHTAPVLRIQYNPLGIFFPPLWGAPRGPREGEWPTKCCTLVAGLRTSGSLPSRNMAAGEWSPSLVPSFQQLVLFLSGRIVSYIQQPPYPVLNNIFNS